MGIYWDMDIESIGVLVVSPTLFQVALAFVLPQPFHFVASLGFFQLPSSAVPRRFWECFVVCVCGWVLFVTPNKGRQVKYILLPL